MKYYIFPQRPLSVYTGPPAAEEVGKLDAYVDEGILMSDALDDSGDTDSIGVDGMEVAIEKIEVDSEGAGEIDVDIGALPKMAIEEDGDDDGKGRGVEENPISIRLTPEGSRICPVEEVETIRARAIEVDSEGPGDIDVDTGALMAIEEDDEDCCVEENLILIGLTLEDRRVCPVDGMEIAIGAIEVDSGRAGDDDVEIGALPERAIKADGKGSCVEGISTPIGLALEDNKACLDDAIIGCALVDDN